MEPIDNNLYAASIKQALKVGFLSNSQEIKLYSNALYSAAMWGREVDRRNKDIRERDKSVK